MGYSKEKTKFHINTTNENEIQLVVIQLYMIFYEKLYILETLLKTKLAQIIRTKFGQSWFNDQIQNSDRIPLISLELILIKRRRKNGFKIDETVLFNEAHFGFWIEFFSKDVYKILKGVPIKIFSDLPKNLKRKSIYSCLSEIKELRNDIYHHKNIFVNGSKTLMDNINSIQKIHDDINLFIHLLDSSYSTYTQLKKIDTVLRKVQRVYSKR